MRFGIELPPQQRVYGGFFIYSFCMGSLPPRLPDIQRAMGIEEGALGFGLIGAALGTLNLAESRRTACSSASAIGGRS